MTDCCIHACSVNPERQACKGKLNRWGACNAPTILITSLRSEESFNKLDSLPQMTDILCFECNKLRNLWWWMQFRAVPPATSFLEQCVPLAFNSSTLPCLRFCPLHRPIFHDEPCLRWHAVAFDLRPRFQSQSQLYRLSDAVSIREQVLLFMHSS